MSKSLVTQIQDAIELAYSVENDEKLADLMLLFMQEPSIYTPKKPCILYEAFDCALFLLNSKSLLMRRMAKDTHRFINHIDFKNKIMDKMGGNLEGLELSNNDSTLFCVLSHETYSEQSNMVRATWYDHKGFSGHINSTSWQKLLDEVVACGYRLIATGYLDMLSKTEEFISGNNASLAWQKQG